MQVKNLDELQNHFPGAEIEEVGSKDVGMSFEPRERNSV